MPTPQGKFVWYELMTTDTAGAEAFYKQVVGWEAEDSGMPGVSYTLLSAGGARVGGLMRLPEDARKSGAEPAWRGYVAVDDVDAMARAVTGKGGTIYRGPDDIPGIGRFAIAADPQGAVFVLFKGQGDSPDAPPAPGTPGHFGWHELYTTDLDSAFAFYSDLFGWTKSEAIDMGPMGIYQTFSIGGVQGGGMMRRPDPPVRPHWLYYVNTDAIDPAVARITAAGGQVQHGPQEVPGGMWIVQGRDAQGVSFALVGPLRET